MYGVVLWTDQRENRAVIWCEDHGDLAFYRGTKGEDAAMAAGDLIEFDLRDGGDMRLADTPRLVTRHSHPTLGAELKRAGARAGAIKLARPVAARRRKGADVIAIDTARYRAYA